MISREEIQRYADKCRELSAKGEYGWWSRLAEILDEYEGVLDRAEDIDTPDWQNGT